MVDKVIENGKVAVLVSYGYGAGWSTWNVGQKSKNMLFDPDVVKWVRDGKPGELCDHVDLEEKYGEYVCDLGAQDLDIQWLDVGTRFLVHEYDGCESIWTQDEMNWIVA